MAAERQCCVPLSCLSPDGPASTLTRQMTLDVAVTHADCAPRPYPRILNQVQGGYAELATDETRGMSPGNTPVRTPIPHHRSWKACVGLTLLDRSPFPARRCPERPCQLLFRQRWPLRSFEKIKYHIGGFQDDELQQLLVRPGALRFKNDDGEETWGFRVRTLDRLD